MRPKRHRQQPQSHLSNPALAPQLVPQLVTRTGEQYSRRHPTWSACRNRLTWATRIYAIVNVWGVAPQKKRSHKGGKKVASGRRNGYVVDLACANIVINLSMHSCVDGEGVSQALTRNCDPENASNRSHRCQICRCGGKCSLSCGCKGSCYLALPPGWTGRAERERTQTRRYQAQSRRVILAREHGTRCFRVLTHLASGQQVKGAVGSRGGSGAGARRVEMRSDEESRACNSRVTISRQGGREEIVAPDISGSRTSSDERKGAEDVSSGCGLSRDGICVGREERPQGRVRTRANDLGETRQAGTLHSRY